MRYLNSFFLTTLLYVSLATLLLFANPFDKLQSQNKEEKKKVSLNYVQIIKPKPIEPIVEEKVEKNLEPEIKKIVKKEPKKKVIKKVEKKKVVKKKIDKIVKKEPIKKQKTKKFEETIIDKVVKKEIPQKVIQKNINKNINYEEDFLANHLHMIKKEIQKNIMYSKRARKLKIEGKVLVEFCLTKSGEIKKVKTLKGHKLLQKSTIEAIYSASANFPKVQKTITIRVPIEYRLI
ncbi:energy transducer TonB [Arcobacter arenosus]|uniref:TonB family protein n=1 Tax=Arcobacter arenosus TaxID=2576037 RepID=A0A5R8XYE5_9BACT|nr:energy transducer TonB [Arcobacter arenosus]TLP36281.1 TonB family protein [Arcobacter arenosus]